MNQSSDVVNGVYHATLIGGIEHPFVRYTRVIDKPTTLTGFELDFLVMPFRNVRNTGTSGEGPPVYLPVLSDAKFFMGLVLIRNGESMTGMHMIPNALSNVPLSGDYVDHLTEPKGRWISQRLKIQQKSNENSGYPDTGKYIEDRQEGSCRIPLQSGDMLSIWIECDNDWGNQIDGNLAHRDQYEVACLWKFDLQGYNSWYPNK